MLTHSGSPIVPRHATSLLRIIVVHRPSTSVMHRIRGGVPNVIHGHTGGRLLSTILHRHWIQLLYRIPNRLKCVIPPLTTFFCFASLQSPNMAAFSFERKLNQSPNMADFSFEIKRRYSWEWPRKLNQRSKCGLHCLHGPDLICFKYIVNLPHGCIFNLLETMRNHVRHTSCIWILNRRGVYKIPNIIPTTPLPPKSKQNQNKSKNQKKKNNQN